MKDRKGFTLVEVLVVIILIGLILIIAIPAMLKINRTTKERSLETKKEAIIKAAEQYASNNRSKFGDATSITIPIKTLLAYGYINSDSKEGECNSSIGCIINPTNNTSMNNELINICKNREVIQARWDECPDIPAVSTFVPTKYTVYFDGNGATSDWNKLECQTSISSPNSCDINMPGITRDSWVIDGWNLSASASSSTNDVNTKLTLNASNNEKTYYAITHKGIKATFNPNGTLTGTSVVPCTLRNTQSTCSVTSPDIEASSNKQAMGWSTTSDVDQAQILISAKSETVPISRDITYYAIQKQLYYCYKTVVTKTCEKKYNSNSTTTTAAVNACNSAYPNAISCTYYKSANATEGYCETGSYYFQANFTTYNSKTKKDTYCTVRCENMPAGYSCGNNSIEYNYDIGEIIADCLYNFSAYNSGNGYNKCNDGYYILSTDKGVTNYQNQGKKAFKFAGDSVEAGYQCTYNMSSCASWHDGTPDKYGYIATITTTSSCPSGFTEKSSSTSYTCDKNNPTVTPSTTCTGNYPSYEAMGTNNKCK